MTSRHLGVKCVTTYPTLLISDDGEKLEMPSRLDGVAVGGAAEHSWAGGNWNRPLSSLGVFIRNRPEPKSVTMFIGELGNNTKLSSFP